MKYKVENVQKEGFCGTPSSLPSTTYIASSNRTTEGNDRIYARKLLLII